MRALIVMAGLLVAAPAMAADQFDLVCHYGKSQVRYRVDLTKNEACSDTCDRVWKMGEASSGQLKLIDRVPAYRGDLEERATVNRQTGEYVYFMRLNGRVDSDRGTCEPALFSGFPRSKF